VKSEYQTGTCVSFIIPARKDDAIENSEAVPDTNSEPSQDNPVVLEKEQVG
jgi:hypothetical protein